MTQDTLPVLIADINAGEWAAHSRFRGIYVKRLLASTDNALASVNVVRVPPGGVIGRHQHPAQVETVYVLAGQSILTLDQTDAPFNAGQVVAIPMAFEHALRNEGSEMVELLTFFTPPLT
jgi:quercetin dioxygenase-like cupin family protein